MPPPGLHQALTEYRKTLLSLPVPKPSGKTRSYVASATNTSLSGAVGEASISPSFQGDSLWPNRMSSLP
jgi:hypothetical protein